MSTETVDPRRVESLYSAVMMLTAEEASRILDMECGDAPALRAAVERMLAEDKNTPPTRILDTPREGTPSVVVDKKSALGVPDSARLGRYIVLRHIAAGGMGDIYVAYDDSLDRRIAVKLLRPSVISDLSLRREAQALARLSHPNVVQVYDIGEYEGQPFVAMELVNGVQLNQWLAAGGRDWEAILRMFVQCGRGLVAAHEAGFVHRDFKPANVVVGDDGRARVLDFGIVSGPSADPESARTLDALMAGTPQYMSPEQLAGEAATAASDQFSFAVSLYRALYAMPPFPGDDVGQMQTNVRNGAVRPPPPGKAPDWVAPILLRALARNSSARYPSLSSMLDEIERHLPRDPDLDPNTSRPARLALALAIIAVVAAILVGAQIRGGFANITPLEFLVVPSSIVGLTAFSMVVFRKRLVTNRYGARMSGVVMLAATTMIAHRLLALHLGQSIRQTLVVDMLMLGFELALAALLFARWFAACAGLMFLGSLVAAFNLPWATAAIIVAFFGSFAIGLVKMARY